MESNKSGVKKGNSRLPHSALFGIIDKVIHVGHTKNTTVKLPVTLNCQARKLALSPVLKAESYKAQAITLIRQTSIR